MAQFNSHAKQLRPNPLTPYRNRNRNPIPNPNPIPNRNPNRWDKVGLYS